MRSRTIGALIVLLAANVANAQSFDEWFESRIQAHINGRNGNGMDKQKESPSGDPRSTSLVDQTSASDFVSVAASVIPVTPGFSQSTGSSASGSAGGGAAGSTTATATFYALLAMLNKVSPTDPNFYIQHVNARRVSFTLGTVTSTPAIDNTDKPGTVYGAKVLLLNGRDIYSKSASHHLRDLQPEIKKLGQESVQLKDRIQKEMFLALNPAKTQIDVNDPDLQQFVLTSFSATNFPHVLASLPSDAKNRIETEIENSLSTFVEFTNSVNSVYDEISKATQLSIGYTADIRDSMGNNYHRAELIFDYGLSPRINWTVNASADYTDRKATLDSRGGRIATSFEGNLTSASSSWGKTPLRLSFSGEAKWLTGQKPQYTFQSQLSIPLSAGIDLPIVYRYANRNAQVDQTSSEARLGLSVDISRLAQALK